MSKSSEARPARLAVLAENIPARLRKLRRWVVWSWHLRNGKWDKPPLQRNGEFAAVDDPNTWTTFDEALAAHQAGRFDGIGFVLGSVAEEGVTYAGVDLDGCRDPQTGEIQDWAVSYLETIRSYAEVSPSGEGIKVLALGTLPGPDRNEGNRLGIEMYRGGRYFTVTGHRLLNAPTEIEERTAELAELYYLIFGDLKKKEYFAPGHDRADDRTLALSALDGLSPSLADGYWDWLRVGMALHAVSDDGDMLRAWDRWSQHCAEKYQPDVCERKWKSFGKKGGLGLGSLIYWARQNGWTLPQIRPKAVSSAKTDAAILERLDSVLAGGAEAFFRDHELLEALARLAETDPPEFACVRAKVQKAKISLGSLDAVISPTRQAIRRERPPLTSAGSYRVVGGRLVLDHLTKDGPVEVPLGNFAARITETVTRDDGVEKTAVFTLEGELANGRPLTQLQVPATEFQRLEWVTTGWHGEAVVLAGASTRDHVRCAIELLSVDRSRRVQYLHTGWRELNGQWVFLHAAGAIGPDGLVAGIDVDLPASLRRVQFLEPASSDDLVLAVRASLNLLSLAADRITVPVLAAIYRAPLEDMDFSMHFAGPSGVFKTELAALAQSHYGAAFDARSLPGSWSSTDNALEELAHAAKDLLLVVDDFKPTGSSYDVQSFHRKADRLFRAVGNHSARQRMSRDGKLRPDRRPRGLVLSTGEEIPHGESLRARLLIAEIAPGDIDRQQLTQCQKDAASGRYALAMFGYLCWLARHYAEIRANIKGERETLRHKALAEATGGHARSPGIVADLAIGLKYFFDFAADIGVLTNAERVVLAKRSWAALREAVAAQAAHVAAAEPTGLFVRLLTAALASGRAHLAGPEGNQPSEPQVWGWRQVELGSGDYARTEWRPQGNRLGWVEVDGTVGSPQVYLEPEACYAEVQKLARDQGESFPTSPRTLHRRLKENGLLASTESARAVLTVRRTLEGQRRAVLHLRTDSLYQRPAQPAQSDANGENSSTCGGQVRHGHLPKATSNLPTDLTTEGAGPDHFSDPTTNLPTATPSPPMGNGEMGRLGRSETQAAGEPENNSYTTDREVFEV